MTARIWIEPVKRPDGRYWYSERWGLLLRTRLDGPDGELLCDRVHNPVCESARALMARGITGPFETRKPGIDYACMTGDIEKTAGLTIREPSTMLALCISPNGSPSISMPFPTARISRQRARIPIPVWEGLPTRTPLYGRTRS